MKTISALTELANTNCTELHCTERLYCTELYCTERLLRLLGNIVFLLMYIKYFCLSFYVHKTGLVQSGEIKEKFKVLRKVRKSERIRENQETCSIDWENLCFPDKIRESLFLLNICVAPPSDCICYSIYNLIE